mmetsp:Transcript_4766/g.9782  ORF Transcript_4766/g.9782 Transcript_4766/m.9782 type:complete len:228 (+) Transcript_4766:73-756(+)
MVAGPTARAWRSLASLTCLVALLPGATATAGAGRLEEKRSCLAHDDVGGHGRGALSGSGPAMLQLGEAASSTAEPQASPDKQAIVALGKELGTVQTEVELVRGALEGLASTEDVEALEKRITALEKLSAGQSALEEAVTKLRSRVAAFETSSKEGHGALGQAQDVLSKRMASVEARIKQTPFNEDVEKLRNRVSGLEAELQNKVLGLVASGAAVAAGHASQSAPHHR